MSNRKIEIQHILLPTQGPKAAEWGLYYQGAENICEKLEDGTSRLLLSHYKDYNFCSYFNGITVEKWARYTKIKSIVLKIEVKGDFEVAINGYHLVAESKQRTTYSRKRFHNADKEFVEMEIPLNTKEIIFGFSIKTYSDCHFYGGYYEAEVDESDFRHVHISVATTTFKKEDYITKNVAMVKKELMEDEEMKNHWSFHVVDNGRTLSKEEIEGDGIYYHPNKNVGGAGGFSRGMIESLKESDDITHVLMMDDDVIILPESLKRTYYMLAMVKEEYKEHVISGAMLYYENMSVFHEDTSYVSDVNHSIKRPANMKSITNMLKNETLSTEMKDVYAAWWYCCVPIHMIKDNGLPLPVFIRGDDIEFGIRNKIKTITMNGICLWHMGFVTKFNAFMNFYQGFRNLLILDACNQCNKEAGIVGYFETALKEEIRRFNYNSAELILDAWEDYLKGPKFIEIEQGEKLLKEKSALNSKFVDLEQLNVSVDVSSIYTWEDQFLIQKIFYKLTDNGHRFWPKKWIDQTPGAVSFDTFYNPARQAFHESVVSVNIYDMQGEVRHMNRTRYKQLKKRYRRIKKDYEANKEKIQSEYIARQPYLTSEKFWNKYLEIEKYQ